MERSNELGEGLEKSLGNNNEAFLAMRGPVSIVNDLERAPQARFFSGPFLIVNFVLLGSVSIGPIFFLDQFCRKNFLGAAGPIFFWDHFGL